MTRYEYRTIRMVVPAEVYADLARYDTAVDEWLNGFGADGWRICGEYHDEIHGKERHAWALFMRERKP